ncbi:hypothetical protein PHMEG_00016950 [Phytophthora megakarya]|uniref:DDE-1 domain-containing protein n=1 Tax=Phytophthora megakarya TaxID=4795 RepID=A0A225VXX6_9STRA|nr:hypothetical protein PHMEG_00016950 [Phytophthora megakarya]
MHEENNALRNGFGTTVWKEIERLMNKYPCQIYDNKTAWWNTDLSVKFLEYHFATRSNRDDNVLLLWDDFSAHWTQPVLDYASSINVILHKVPPKYTYVCQPADSSWNKPFKVAHRQGESERQRKKDKLNAKILLIQKSDDREQASRKVVCLRKKLNNIRLHLAAPSRPQMTDWITSS